ncbi:MAG: peptide ABC transporter substrate-binding protein [Solobacterium sp.]|nr:peptide ABC transporter substrate-binding protein [Solobacterium sp.]
MKKYFATLLSAVMALSLAACGTDTSAGTPAPTAASSNTDGGTATAAPADGGSTTAVSDIKLADTENLVETTSYELQSMDYVVSAKTEDHEYNANFVDGLLENDTYGNLKDCIAESYEQSEDGLKWTFHLKKGVKWVTADGEEYDEVKAEDFVTGLRHGVEFNSETAWLLEGVIKGYLEYESSDFSDAEWEKVGVKALDDYTLEFTLEAPAPYFPSMTCYAVLYPINKTFLEGKGTGCKLGSPDIESCTFGQVAPDSILYNGGFLLESNDLKSSTVLKKNEAYWDAENVHLKSVKRIYDDGSDPYSGIRGFEAGTYARSAISPLWEDFDSYMNKYDGYVNASLPDHSTFGVVFNMNRQVFDQSNYCEGDPAANENTHKAILNENFRKALRAAYDVKAYNMVTSPESIALSMIRNINNDSNIVRTSDGKNYGELVNEAYAAIAGDEKADLSDGQYAWLNKENALAYIEKAKADGIEFPVHLDMLVDETSKARSDRGRSMKDSIEANTDGQIIIELVMRDSDTVTNIAYRNNDPAAMDYDISTFTGWGPDYADPKTFVDIYSPVTGYYMKAMGLEAGEKTPDAGIKEQVGLNDYEKLYRAADAIVDDMDARYKKFAEADAALVKTAFYIPTSTNTRTVRVSHEVPFTRYYSVCGMTEYKYKGLQLQEDIVTSEAYDAAYAKWEKGE